MLHDDQPRYNKDEVEWPARSQWLHLKFDARNMRQRLDDGEPQEGDSEEAWEALDEQATSFGECFGPF